MSIDYNKKEDPRTKSSSGGVQGGEINILKIKEKIDSLEETAKELLKNFERIDNLAKEISKSFNVLKGDIEKFQNYANKAIFVIMVAFFFSVVLISLDYFRNNEDRYESIIEKITETKKDYYTKEQVNNYIFQNENQLESFKKCLKNGGWNSCF